MNHDDDLRAALLSGDITAVKNAISKGADPKIVLHTITTLTPKTRKIFELVFPLVCIDINDVEYFAHLPPYFLLRILTTKNVNLTQMQLYTRAVDQQSIDNLPLLLAYGLPSTKVANIGKYH